MKAEEGVPRNKAGKAITSALLELDVPCLYTTLIRWNQIHLADWNVTRQSQRKHIFTHSLWGLHKCLAELAAWFSALVYLSFYDLAIGIRGGNAISAMVGCLEMPANLQRFPDISTDKSNSY